MRQHKIWVEVSGGSGKSFGCGQDDAITLNVNVGASASNSKHLSKIKIEHSLDDEGEISFYISIDGQNYRSEVYNKKKQQFKGITGRKIDGSIEAAQKREDEATASFMRMTSTVAKMASIFTDTKQEANDWKVRMLNAGLSTKGLTMPENWNELTEDEKEVRLNNVIEALQ